ncbi:MAG: hypothetical protein ACOC3V_05715 [bacterium]
MKKPLIISIVLIIVALVFIGLFILGNYLNKDSISNDEEKQENKTNETEKDIENLDEIEQECIKLGCEKGSVYIGSVNSDKFYRCDCRWAETISKENIICFKTRQEALNDDRVESEC